MQVTINPIITTKPHQHSVETIDSMIDNLKKSLKELYFIFTKRLSIFALIELFNKMNNTKNIEEKVKSLTDNERLLFQKMDIIDKIKNNLNDIVDHLIKNPDDIHIDRNDFNIEKILHSIQNDQLKIKLKNYKTLDLNNNKPIIKNVLQDPEIPLDVKRLLIQSLIKIDIDIHWSINHFLGKKSLSSLFKAVNSFNDIKEQIDIESFQRPSSPVSTKEIWTLEGNIEIIGEVHVSEISERDPCGKNLMPYGFHNDPLYKKMPLLIILILSLAYPY